MFNTATMCDYCLNTFQTCVTCAFVQSLRDDDDQKNNQQWPLHVLVSFIFVGSTRVLICRTPKTKTIHAIDLGFFLFFFFFHSPTCDGFTNDRGQCAAVGTRRTTKFFFFSRISADEHDKRGTLHTRARVNRNGGRRRYYYDNHARTITIALRHCQVGARTWISYDDIITPGRLAVATVLLLLPRDRLVRAYAYPCAACVRGPSACIIAFRVSKNTYFFGGGEHSRRPYDSPPCACGLTDDRCCSTGHRSWRENNKTATASRRLLSRSVYNIAPPPPWVTLYVLRTIRGISHLNHHHRRRHPRGF